MAGVTAAARGGEDPGFVNLYIYHLGNRPKSRFGAFLWLEPHTQACAWWLINSWRIRQYSEGSYHAFANDELLVSAACARSLVESAAALYADTLRLSRIWSACKSEHPSLARPLPAAFSELRAWTYEVIGAGRFDAEGATKTVAERVKRVNVKTHIQKLAKLGFPDLIEDYDWLCNTVHPSLGATFAFSGEVLERVPRTEVLVSFAEHPAASFPDRELDTTIANIIQRASAVALRVATVALDGALRVIDDLGLTTQAPPIATFDYRRRISAPGRNDPCPCRSGRKSKLCIHD